MLGNLFYRGLILLTPVFIGDTLRTRTEVVALKQNSRRADGSATGLVALRIRTHNQRGEPVLDFWRCPMIPLREPAAETGHADRFDQIPDELELERVVDAAPAGWDFDGAARGRARASASPSSSAGTVYEVEGRDTVTAAPELARLTLNVAKAHTDAGGSLHGRRLVYGGHTISIAAAHLSRALPALATIVAWRGCDHLGPVFEGDVLRDHASRSRDGTSSTGPAAGLVDLRMRWSRPTAGRRRPCRCSTGARSR